MAHEYYRFEQTTQCLGWAAERGPCGAEDCTSCHPGCDQPAETSRDLTGHGFNFDIDDGYWWRKIRSTDHVARRDHKDGRIKKGDRYTKTTWRYVEDETGETWLSHHKAITQRVVSC